MVFFSAVFLRCIFPELFETVFSKGHFLHPFFLGEFFSEFRAGWSVRGGAVRELFFLWFFRGVFFSGWYYPVLSSEIFFVVFFTLVFSGFFGGVSISLSLADFSSIFPGRF